MGHKIAISDSYLGPTPDNHALENLANSGQLKREPGDPREFDGLVRSAQARLADARKHPLSIA